MKILTERQYKEKNRNRKGEDKERSDGARFIFKS